MDNLVFECHTNVLFSLRYTAFPLIFLIIHLYFIYLNSASHHIVFTSNHASFTMVVILSLYSLIVFSKAASVMFPSVLSAKCPQRNLYS